MEAIRLAILEERETEENSTNQWVTNFIMTNPVVVGVDGPYQETYDELAALFYESGKKNTILPCWKSPQRRRRSLWQNVPIRNITFPASA